MISTNTKERLPALGVALVSLFFMITKTEWTALQKEWFGCKYAAMQPADAVRARCSDDSARIERLESALDPRTWTLEMSAAWHKNLPDTHAAFAAIFALANVPAQPRAEK